MEAMQGARAPLNSSSPSWENREIKVEKKEKPNTGEDTKMTHFLTSTTAAERYLESTLCSVTVSLTKVCI
jgi:hypothetical protein